MVRSRTFAAFIGLSSVLLLTPPALATAPSGFLAGRAAPGAKVLLYAWPAQSVLAHLEPGQQVPMRLVETTAATSAGSYRLTAPAMSGPTNFEADALTPAGVASHSFLAASASQTDTATLTPLAHSFTTSIQPRDNITRCVVSFQKTLGKAWSIVGQTYSTSAKVDESFDYQQGASSEMGVGVSATGGFGTFTSGGTSGTSSSLDVAFPTQSGRKYTYYKSRFRMGLYKTHCTWTGGSSSHYSSRVTNFSGGATVAHPASAPKTPATYCDRWDNGSIFTLQSTRAVTWSNGLDVSSLIGTSLSASTGYSTGAEIVYTIHKNNAQVCGTGGDAGGGHPYQVVAH